MVDVGDGLGIDFTILNYANYIKTVSKIVPFVIVAERLSISTTCPGVPRVYRRRM